MSPLPHELGCNEVEWVMQEVSAGGWNESNLGWSWSVRLLLVKNVMELYTSFGLEWGLSFGQSQCGCYHRKNPLKLRLNGAPATCHTDPFNKLSAAAR